MTISDTKKTYKYLLKYDYRAANNSPGKIILSRLHITVDSPLPMWIEFKLDREN